MKKVKLTKNLAKKLEKDIEQAFFRYTKEKGLEFGYKFWQEIFKSEKDLLDIGKAIIIKTIPTKQEHTGEIKSTPEKVTINYVFEGKKENAQNRIDDVNKNA